MTASIAGKPLCAPDASNGLTGSYATHLVVIPSSLRAKLDDLSALQGLKVPSSPIPEPVGLAGARAALKLLPKVARRKHKDMYWDTYIDLMYAEEELTLALYAAHALELKERISSLRCKLDNWFKENGYISDKDRIFSRCDTPASSLDTTIPEGT